MNSIELQNRLLKFTTEIITYTKSVNKNYVGEILSKQIIRSGTSISLNYAEVRGSESMKDFIHKMHVVLKELRETEVCLKLIGMNKLVKPRLENDPILEEANQLIAIFVSSITSAKQNLAHTKSANR